MQIRCIFIMVLKLSYFHKLEDTLNKLFPGIVSPTVSEDVREASYTAILTYKKLKGAVEPNIRECFVVPSVATSLWQNDVKTWQNKAEI